MASFLTDFDLDMVDLQLVALPSEINKTYYIRIKHHDIDILQKGVFVGIRGNASEIFGPPEGTSYMFRNIENLFINNNRITNTSFATYKLKITDEHDKKYNIGFNRNPISDVTNVPQLNDYIAARGGTSSYKMYDENALTRERIDGSEWKCKRDYTNPTFYIKNSEEMPLSKRLVRNMTRSNNRDTMSHIFPDSRKKHSKSHDKKGGRRKRTLKRRHSRRHSSSRK